MKRYLSEKTAPHYTEYVNHDWNKSSTNQAIQKLLITLVCNELPHPMCT